MLLEGDEVGSIEDSMGILNGQNQEQI